MLDGFRLAATEQGGAWIHAARPEVELPLDGSGVIRFRRSTGREIRVRELGAAGEGRTTERAVSYPRVGGTSFWTAIDGGVEEWLLLDEGLARDGEAVAAWHVEGATLRARGDAVELLDEQSGAPVLRVTAPWAPRARRSAAAGRRAAGIRPEVARTFIERNVELQSIVVKRSLQSGIAGGIHRDRPERRCSLSPGQC